MGMDGGNNKLIFYVVVLYKPEVWTVVPFGEHKLEALTAPIGLLRDTEEILLVRHNAGRTKFLNF